MPEGDSVLQLSNKMQFMVGREVTHTSIRVPRYATATFTGDYCENVWPYGKHLFMQFGEQILHTHLKMEGQWSIHYEGDKWRKPGFSARVVLRLANTPRDIEVVGHSLGNVDVYPIDNYYDH
ncbi:MAG: DNA-formamidopyrimidine glycosylase family protein, partial [Corynebacterium casei]|nr:DNA-formamidopyrimidine glycosylase family protein [Corynebacterium casei]